MIIVRGWLFLVQSVFGKIWRLVQSKQVELGKNVVAIRKHWQKFGGKIHKISIWNSK